MKILIALPYFPYPPKAGGHQATFHMINYLRTHMTVTLICPYAEHDDLLELRTKWPEVSIEVTSNDKFSERKKTLLHHARHVLIRGRLYVKNLRAKQENKQAKANLGLCNKIRIANMRLYRDNFTYHDKQFVDKFQELVTSQDFDIIQVEFAEFLGLVHCMPEKPVKLFVHHELSFVIIKRELKTLDQITAFDRYLLEQARMIELALLNKYDKVLVLSNEDKAILNDFNFPSDKLFVSPFAVPAHSSLQKTSVNFLFKNKIVFLGSENHNPNLDAVYWFVKDVLPLILREMPLVTFYVIGYWRKEIIKLFAAFPHVVFTGFVESLGEMLDGAVMVVPIRIGSGMRTKIMDAVMRHVPVITTTIGVEGIPLEDGKDCLIADTPEMFVQKLGLFHDKVDATTLLNNAFKKISQRGDINEYGELRKHIYEAIL